jgi:hypothetical protein
MLTTRRQTKGNTSIPFAHAKVAATAREVRAYLERQEELKKMGPTVVHVKDGRPLTARGAEMLGVKWPPEEVHAN